MNPAVIVDSIMGSGKTSWAYQFITSHPNEKFIFITPFLSECDEIIKSCPSSHFYQPRDEKVTKHEDFIRLFKKGRNIVTTHKLFETLKLTDEEYVEFKEKNYIFIIDEVIDTVEIHGSISQSELDVCINNKWISFDDDDIAKFTAPEDTKFDLFENFMKTIKRTNITIYKNSLLVWSLSSYILKLAKRLIVLTFLFDSSYLAKTFEINKIRYEYYHVERNSDGFQLVRGVEDLTEKKKELREMIDICQDERFNCIGNDMYDLSAKKWKNSKDSKEIRALALKKVRNYFSYGASPDKERIPANKCMWTCYKVNNKVPPLKDYQRSWVVFNKRAEDNYSNREYLAYIPNVFPHTEISNWFREKGAALDDNKIALATLLQWIWRSAIRRGGKIHIFIPSSRMRHLLENWLNNKA